MPPTKPANIDPRVSCPIVVGDYMRATGFFFEADELYLITARHNVLPTTGSNLKTGDFPMKFEMSETFYKIDVYLRSGNAFTVETLHFPELSCIIVDPCIDVIAIQIPFDPRSHGYTVLGPENIVDNKVETQTFDTIGFPGISFPPPTSEYDTETYAEHITYPHVLTTSAPLPPETLQLNNLENIAVTRVNNDGDSNFDYCGLSGSPVLGDGLAGIHTSNLPVQIMNFETGQRIDGMVTTHWKAEIILYLLGQSQVGQGKTESTLVDSNEAD